LITYTFLVEKYIWYRFKQLVSTHHYLTVRCLLQEPADHSVSNGYHLLL